MVLRTGPKGSKSFDQEFKKKIRPAPNKIQYQFVTGIKGLLSKQKTFSCDFNLVLEFKLILNSGKNFAFNFTFNLGLKPSESDYQKIFTARKHSCVCDLKHPDEYHNKLMRINK